MFEQILNNEDPIHKITLREIRTGYEVRYIIGGEERYKETFVTLETAWNFAKGLAIQL